MKVRSFLCLVVLVASLVFPGVPGHAAQWADEFNGSGGPSAAHWNFDIGGGGWGNNELQNYQYANTWQTAGMLQIQAKKQSLGGYAYTSARIKTEGKRSFGPYGYLQARIQGPNGQGLWPAFWLLGTNIGSVGWPSCGEIDVMEHVNSDANVFGTLHWMNGVKVSYTAMNTPTSFTGWHVYSINWTSSSITWYIDYQVKGSANIQNSVNGTDEFHRPFFAILNLAVGGDWPGPPNASTPFPANFNIDWIAWN